MAQFQNTLYVTTQGAFLAKDHDTVVVRVDREARLTVPLHHLGGIVCFGRVAMSPELMAACAGSGIGISFLTENGRFLARVEGEASGNVLLRRAQYRAADDPGRCCRLARSFVVGKVANARAVVMRAAREAATDEGREALEGAAARLAAAGSALLGSAAIEAVRGHEGDAAATYFGAFDHLIRKQKDAFRFDGRNRRPPRDPVNALLSFLYALLLHDCASALQATGLDPAVGFLHVDRPGRLGLALDLMEELRPILADRLAVSLINLEQLRFEGFVARETGAIEMREDARKTVLVAYQKRKQEELKHPFVDERMTWARVPHVQARLLARTIRGDLDDYPAFLLK
jgi:CRISPR-associated protein Cas1